MSAYLILVVSTIVIWCACVLVFSTIVISTIVISTIVISTIVISAPVLVLVYGVYGHDHEQHHENEELLKSGIRGQVHVLTG